VRPADDRYCGHIVRTCLHDGGAAQPPVRELSLEARPAEAVVDAYFWRVRFY